MKSSDINKLRIFLDDMINLYVPEFCDEERVKQAKERSSQHGGRLSYIANMIDIVESIQKENI